MPAEVTLCFSFLVPMATSASFLGIVPIFSSHPLQDPSPALTLPLLFPVPSWLPALVVLLPLQTSTLSLLPRGPAVPLCPPRTCLFHSALLPLALEQPAHSLCSGLLCNFTLITSSAGPFPCLLG